MFTRKISDFNNRLIKTPKNQTTAGIFEWIFVDIVEPMMARVVHYFWCIDWNTLMMTNRMNQVHFQVSQGQQTLLAVDRNVVRFIFGYRWRGLLP
jgi:hypothetical protein